MIHWMDKSKRGSWKGLKLVLGGWLAMTAGLYAAASAGSWVQQAGGAYGTVQFVQAVVAATIVLSLVYALQRGLGLRLRLLPWSGKSALSFVCGFGLPCLMAAAGLATAVSQGLVTITAWQATPGLFAAIAAQLVIAALYEALPEELTLRGLVYSGLRMRLPAVLAYLGQIGLFVMVPVTVNALQRWTGQTTGVDITLDYIILLLAFGITLQLWRSLTGSLWASIGFHLAYLTLSRFVVLPRGEQALLRYTEHEAETGALFVLFGMTVIGTALVLLAILGARWIWRRRR